MVGNAPRWKRVSALFAVLTVGAMALFFSRYDPWVAIGPEQIVDGGFESGRCRSEWRGWDDLVRQTADGGFGGSGGVTLLTASNRNGVLRRAVSDLGSIPAFRASLRAKASGVRRGERAYHVPRALFYYRDLEGRGIWKIRHGIIDLADDADWRFYSDVFPVPERVLDAQFHIQNLGFGGILQIDDVSLVPVRPRRSAPWWKLFFGTLWMGAFSVCLFALAPWRRRFGLLVTITAFLILGGIVMPSDTLDDGILSAKRSVTETLKPLCPAPAPGPAIRAVPSPEDPRPAPPGVPQTPEREMNRAHEIGHLALFSLLGALAALCWVTHPVRFRRVLVVIAGGSAFAAATEVLQYITPDREAGWNDLFTDLRGIVPAILAVALLRLMQRASLRRSA